MPAIHIRNVPPDVHAALRERARSNGRSMQQELLDILSRVASESVRPAAAVPLQLKLVRVGDQQTTWSREEIYGDDAR